MSSESCKLSKEERGESDHEHKIELSEDCCDHSFPWIHCDVETNGEDDNCNTKLNKRNYVIHPNCSCPGALWTVLIYTKALSFQTDSLTEKTAKKVHVCSCLDETFALWLWVMQFLWSIFLKQWLNYIPIYGTIDLHNDKLFTEHLVLTFICFNVNHHEIRFALCLHALLKTVKRYYSLSCKQKHKSMFFSGLFVIYHLKYFLLNSLYIMFE